MATCDNDMRDDGRGARMPHQYGKQNQRVRGSATKITYSIIADYPARFPVQEQTLEGGNGNMKRRNLKAEERHAAKAKVAMNIQAGILWY